MNAPWPCFNTKVEIQRAEGGNFGFPGAQKSLRLLLKWSFLRSRNPETLDITGLPPEFTPCLIRGGSDKLVMIQGLLQELTSVIYDYIFQINKGGGFIR